MAHCDAREVKWRGNWWMECVTSTLHTTSEHVVSSISTADAHTSAASSWLNWRPRRFKWTRPFRRKTKSGFCACAITFQTQSTPYGPGSHSVSCVCRYLERVDSRLSLSPGWIVYSCEGHSDGYETSPAVCSVRTDDTYSLIFRALHIVAACSSDTMVFVYPNYTL